MKKKIIGIVFITFFTLNSFAQEPWLPSLSFGYSMSDVLNYNDAFKTTFRPSFNVGLDFQMFRIAPRTYLTTDIYYQRLGTKINSEGYNFKVKNDYVQFSLKPRFYFIEESFWDGPPGYYFDLGPYASYLLKSRQDGTALGMEYDNINTIDFYETLDYGISASIGVAILQSLFFELNYNYGLSEINSGGGNNHFFSLNLMLSSMFFEVLFTKPDYNEGFED